MLHQRQKKTYAARPPSAPPPTPTGIPQPHTRYFGTNSTLVSCPDRLSPSLVFRPLLLLSFLSLRLHFSPPPGHLSQPRNTTFRRFDPRQTRRRCHSFSPPFFFFRLHIRLRRIKLVEIYVAGTLAKAIDHHQQKLSLQPPTTTAPIGAVSPPASRRPSTLIPRVGDA